MKIFAKKSLGQNFLRSESALRAIAEAGEILEKDTILEIGPGLGALTEKLLEKAGTVVAVEKDRNLKKILEEKFAGAISAEKLILIEKDILQFDPAEESEAFLHGLADLPRGPEEKLRSLRPHFKIIANIPYNITGAILKKFLSAEHQPSMMVLLVQKEVAERIMAREQKKGRSVPGKESILSISVKAYGTPEMIVKVPAGAFSPAPKVDSAVIRIAGISKEYFKKNGIAEDGFFELVKKGFGQKRKKLAGNLAEFGKKEEISALLEKIGKKDARAEELSLENWARICQSFRKLG